MNDRLLKRAIMLPGRSLWSGLPIATAIVAFLWGTGYPAEEWPFIGGIVTVFLFLSAILVGLGVFFIGRWEDRYGRRVLLRCGIDVDRLDSGDAVSGASKIAVLAFVLLLMSSAIWGAATSGLVLVVSRMDMPPLGPEFGVISLVLLGVGLFGLLVAFGIPAVLFFLVSRNSLREESSAMQARAGTVRSVLGPVMAVRTVPFFPVRLD